MVSYSDSMFVEIFLFSFIFFTSIVSGTHTDCVVLLLRFRVFASRRHDNCFSFSALTLLVGRASSL